MKLIKSIYCPKLGKSIVVLADRYGRYEGQAQVHPDDVEFANELTGCRLAEDRAMLKYLKKNLNRNKIALKTTQSLLSDLQHNVKNIDPIILKRFRIRQKEYTKNIKDFEHAINWLNKSIKDSIINQDKIHKKIKGE